MTTTADYLRRDLLPALQRSQKLDPDKIDDVLAYAERHVKIRMRAGHGPGGGFGVSADDVARFVADAETRRGWIKPEAAPPPPPSADRSEFSPAEFRSLSPVQRLLFANRGVRRDEEGNVHVVVDAPRR